MTNAKVLGIVKPENIDNLTQAIKESSLSRLKLHCKRDNIEIVEIATEPLVFAHWMSFVLLSGKSVRILFKIYYMSNSARFFSEKSYSAASQNVSILRASDFLREFCNLTAGNIKLLLAASHIPVGISLPIMARGFDEIFYPRKHDSIIKNWKLQCEAESLFCSAHISVFEDFEFTPNQSLDEATGEVEFL